LVRGSGEAVLTPKYSNGELDATFAGSGSLASTQVVSGLQIQTDGKIVAVGGSGANLVLARYLSN
jgi:hypothetical protein